MENNRGRLFISSEYSSDPPTQAEEKFALSFTQEALVQARKKLEDLFGSFAGFSGLTIGAVHERWYSTLAPHSISADALVRFVRAPGPLVELPPISKRFSVGVLEEEDIQAIMEGERIARKRAYILTRLPTSICVRVTSEDENTEPVAWVMVNSDGSLGTLHVVPEYRRQGLAKVLINLSVAQTQTEQQEGDYSTGLDGWCYAYVDVENDSSMQLFNRMDGWTHSAVTYWIKFGRFL
jgi:ribosomal protein S18 acetylase RimI-like enzyme